MCHLASKGLMMIMMIMMGVSLQPSHVSYIYTFQLSWVTRECVDQGASCAGYAEHVYTGCLVFWDNPDLAITSSINFT